MPCDASSAHVRLLCSQTTVIFIYQGTLGTHSARGSLVITQRLIKHQREGASLYSSLSVIPAAYCPLLRQGSRILHRCLLLCFIALPDEQQHCAVAVSTLLYKGGGEVGLEDGQGVDGGQQPQGCSQLPALKGVQGLQHSLAVDRGVVAADERDQRVGTQVGDSALQAGRSISGGKQKHRSQAGSAIAGISSALCVVCTPDSCSCLLK